MAEDTLIDSVSVALVGPTAVIETNMNAMMSMVLTIAMLGIVIRQMK